jgi:vancomycin permeability regulator SanA
MIRFKKYLLLFVVWFVVHAVYIIFDGLSDEQKTADIAVILGTKVNTDGSLSERLKKRVECGWQLYQNGRVKKIVVSGGLGREGFYEGTKMKEYLIQKGVADTAVIVDNDGYNTRATVKNVLQLRDSLHFNSVIVVSQYFHLTRTKKLFRKRDFYNVSSLAPKYFEMRDVYAIPREFIAYYLQ